MALTMQWRHGPLGGLSATLRREGQRATISAATRKMTVGNPAPPLFVSGSSSYL